MRIDKKTGEPLEAFGFNLDDLGRPIRTEGRIDLSSPSDYGADPIGDGTFRMVPSGDIVSFEERNKRLKLGCSTAPSSFRL